VRCGYLYFVADRLVIENRAIMMEKNVSAFLTLIYQSMNIKNTFLLFCLFLILISCKKIVNPDLPEHNIYYPEFYPMKTGNYWIYEVYKISTNGNEVITGGIDSIYVTKDTLINGNIFFETNHSSLINSIIIIKKSIYVTHLGF